VKRIQKLDNKKKMNATARQQAATAAAAAATAAGGAAEATSIVGGIEVMAGNPAGPQGIAPLFNAQQLVQIVNAIQNPPVPPAVPNPFALTPYGTVLDTTQKRDAELYSQAVRKFDPTYDGTLINLQSFVDKIKQQTEHLQCTAIFSVTTMNHMDLDLFTKYTTITLADVRTMAITRWGGNDWNKQSSYIMGIVIMDSLNDDFRTRVIDKRSNYQIKDGGSFKTDGPLLMKVIFTLVSPEKSYTAFTLIQDLNTLSPLDHEGSIIKLHHAFRTLIQRIQGTSTGTVALPEDMQRFYLLQAYDKIHCDSFNDFVKQIKNGDLPILKEMARQGFIDKRLANVTDPPLCAGCQFGKQTRRAWRHKPSKKKRQRKPAKRPGDLISVDTMNSLSVPGLLSQMRGRPTLARYH
jgi:hypothetical protein